MAAFPLYAELQFGGYSLQDASVIERSDVERGPAKTRRTATDPLVTTNASITFRSRTDIAAFRAWYYSASGANAGAGWVDWKDPRTDTMRSIRFVSMGALTPLAGRFAVAQMPVVFEYLETVEEVASLAPRRWDFAADTEGWMPYGQSTVLTWQGGHLHAVPANGDRVIIVSPPSLRIRGGLYPFVRALVRRRAGAGWSGGVYYGTVSHGETDDFRKDAPNRPPQGSDWTVIEWDMSRLSTGGADWVSSEIEHVRIDLGATIEDQFDIDWIEVGA